MREVSIRSGLAFETQEGGLEGASARIHWAKREIEAMLGDSERSRD